MKLDVVIYEIDSDDETGFVATCPALNVESGGTTEAGAIDNIRAAAKKVIDEGATPADGVGPVRVVSIDVDETPAAGS